MMKLVFVFLFSLLSLYSLGQTRSRIIPLTSVKITEVKTLPSELRIAEKTSEMVKKEKDEGEPLSIICSRRVSGNYYVDGIKVGGKVKRDEQIVLDGNLNKTYSREDIDRMPKETNLFDSIWLK